LYSITTNKAAIILPPNSRASWKETQMQRLVLAISLLLALIGPSLAQNAPTGKKTSALAKVKQSAGCRFVGTVRGTKLWAGDCVAAEPSAPRAAEAAEPSLQERAQDAVPGGKE
jgi:hypothetical protein